MDIFLGVLLAIALSWAVVATKAWTDSKVQVSNARRRAGIANKHLADLQADDMRLLKQLMKDARIQADLIIRSDYE